MPVCQLTRRERAKHLWIWGRWRLWVLLWRRKRLLQKGVALLSISENVIILIRKGVGKILHCRGWSLHFFIITFALQSLISLTITLCRNGSMMSSSTWLHFCCLGSSYVLSCLCRPVGTVWAFDIAIQYLDFVFMSSADLVFPFISSSVFLKWSLAYPVWVPGSQYFKDILCQRVGIDHHTIVSNGPMVHESGLVLSRSRL